MDYGLNAFRELMEKRYKECDDPMSSPFGSDPFSQQEIVRRRTRKEVFNYVIEMIPEDHQPMKDHVFREEVNALKQVCLNYANTDQLRSRLADFLQSFKEKCQ